MTHHVHNQKVPRTWGVKSDLRMVGHMISFHLDSGVSPVGYLGILPSPDPARLVFEDDAVVDLGEDAWLQRTPSQSSLEVHSTAARTLGNAADWMGTMTG